MAFVSVTRLHLTSRWRLLPFLLHAHRSQRQARRSPGFVAGWLASDPEWGFWTSTVWENLDAMHAFRNGGAHLRAMPKLLHWCDEASFVHWEQSEAAPPDASAAFDRLSRDGRQSHLKGPSARHLAGALTGSRAPRVTSRLTPSRS
jgi:hypothetical protein